MKTTYTIYRADGTKEDGEVDWPPAPGFDLINNFICPIVKGPMEHVSVSYRGKRADMFIDEMGHIRAEEGVLNVEATKIYRTYAISQGKANEHYIVNDVVVFDRIVWG